MSDDDGLSFTEDLSEEELAEETDKIERIPAMSGGIGRYVDPDKLRGYKISVSLPESSPARDSAEVDSNPIMHRQIRCSSDDGISSNASPSFSANGDKETSSAANPTFPKTISFAEEIKKRREERKAQSFESMDFLFASKSDTERDPSPELLKLPPKIKIELPSKTSNEEKFIPPFSGGIGRFSPAKSVGDEPDTVIDDDPTSPWFKPASDVFLTKPEAKTLDQNRPQSKNKQRRKVHFNETGDGRIIEERRSFKLEEVFSFEDKESRDSSNQTPSMESSVSNHGKAIIKPTLNFHDLKDDRYMSDEDVRMPTSVSVLSCGCGVNLKRAEYKSESHPELSTKLEELVNERKKKLREGRLASQKSFPWVTGVGQKFLDFLPVPKNGMKNRSGTNRISPKASEITGISRTSSGISSVLLESPDRDEPDWLKKEKSGMNSEEPDWLKEECMKAEMEERSISRGCFITTARSP